MLVPGRTSGTSNSGRRSILPRLPICWTVGNMSSYPPALRFLPLLCRESSFSHGGADLGFRGATSPLSHLHAYLSGLRGPAFHFPGLAIPCRSGNRPCCEPFGGVSRVPARHRWRAEPAFEVHQVHIRQALP